MHLLLFLFSTLAFSQTTPECEFLKKNSFAAFAQKKPLFIKIFREKEPYYFNNAASSVDNEVQSSCRNGLNQDYLSWSNGCQRLQGEDIKFCNQLVSHYIEYAEAYRAGVKDAQKR